MDTNLVGSEWSDDDDFIDQDFDEGNTQELSPPASDVRVDITPNATALPGQLSRSSSDTASTSGMLKKVASALSLSIAKVPGGKKTVGVAATALAAVFVVGAIVRSRAKKKRKKTKNSSAASASKQLGSSKLRRSASSNQKARVIRKPQSSDVPSVAGPSTPSAGASAPAPRSAKGLPSLKKPASKSISAAAPTVDSRQVTATTKTAATPNVEATSSFFRPSTTATVSSPPLSESPAKTAPAGLSVSLPARKQVKKARPTPTGAAAATATATKAPPDSSTSQSTASALAQPTPSQTPPAVISTKPEPRQIPNIQTSSLITQASEPPISCAQVPEPLHTRPPHPQQPSTPTVRPEATTSSAAALPVPPPQAAAAPVPLPQLPRLPKLSPEQERSVASIITPQPKPDTPSRSRRSAATPTRSVSEAKPAKVASVPEPPTPASATAKSVTFSQPWITESSASFSNRGLATGRMSWSDVADADDRDAELAAAAREAAAAAAAKKVAQEQHDRIVQAKLNADARPFIPPTMSRSVPTSPSANMASRTSSAPMHPIKESTPSLIAPPARAPAASAKNGATTQEIFSEAISDANLMSQAASAHAEAVHVTSEPSPSTKDTVISGVMLPDDVNMVTDAEAAVLPDASAAAVSSQLPVSSESATLPPESALGSDSSPSNNATTAPTISSLAQESDSAAPMDVTNRKALGSSATAKAAEPLTPAEGNKGDVETSESGVMQSALSSSIAMAASSTGGQGTMSASMDDDAPLLCAVDDSDVFQHSPLTLVGRDIDPAAEPTADEQTADEQLMKLAQLLQAGLHARHDIVQQGIQELQKDIDFCATHNCRPHKYAEHASTAADFLFQVHAYKEAEQVLDGAIQAAAVTGDTNLEATLINNMGTILRKQQKYKQALSLHRQHMDSVLERHGLQSQYTTLARSNLVEVLELLKKRDEALSLLLEQAQQNRLEAEKVEASHGEATTSDGDAESASAPLEGGPAGDTRDPVKVAWASTARCYLDLARFVSRCNDIAKAGEHAQTALDYAKKAHGEESPATAVYLSFIAGNLKLQAERTGEAELFKQAREGFLTLTTMVENAEGVSRSLPSLYKSLAETSLKLGEKEKAYEYARKVVSIVAQLIGASQSDPRLETIWHFVEKLHDEGGDAVGVEAARKAILKCKASSLRGRDASHRKKSTSARAKAVRKR